MVSFRSVLLILMLPIFLGGDGGFVEFFKVFFSPIFMEILEYIFLGFDWYTNIFPCVCVVCVYTTRCFSSPIMFNS